PCQRPGGRVFMSRAPPRRHSRHAPPPSAARSDDFLKGPATLDKGVAVAKEAPTIDFLYYPGQNYPGKPWSNWGDSVAAGGKYYASIGDHMAVGGRGDPAHGTGTA